MTAVPLITIPRPTDEITTLDDIELGDEHPHLECCRVERFFCGRPFHPELSACELESPGDEVCARCMEILHDNHCWRGHQHCPIPLLQGLVCPDA
jgi:hypothetical protein